MNNQQKQTPIEFRCQYIPERKSVLIWVSSAAMFEMPFYIFKQFWHEMDKAHKGAQILVPDNRIVIPGQPQ
jgi:hypothetical protein